MLCDGQAAFLLWSSRARQRYQLRTPTPVIADRNICRSLPLPRRRKRHFDKAACPGRHASAAVVGLSKIPSIRSHDGDAGAGEVHRCVSFVAQSNVLGKARRVDRLISEVQLGRTQLYEGAGARQRNLLGTAGSVVGDGDGSTKSALVSRLEGNVDRAACSGVKNVRAVVCPTELACYSTGGNMQVPKASIRKRDLLSHTGGEDDLCRKSQTRGREGHSE